jgi:hypothetical protein
MLSVTLMADIVAVAGMPDTGMLCITPFGVLSGTATLIVPELKHTEVDVDEELISLTAGSFKHIVTGLGVTFGAGGV